MRIAKKAVAATFLGVAAFLVVSCPAYADHIMVGEKTQVALIAPQAIQSAENVEQITLRVNGNGCFKVDHDNYVSLSTYKGKLTLSPKRFGSGSVSVTWRAYGVNEDGDWKLIKRATKTLNYMADKMVVPAEYCDEAIAGKKVSLKKLTKGLDRYLYFLYVNGFSKAAANYKLQKGSGYKIYKKAGNHGKIAFTRGGRNRSVNFRVNGTDCKVVFKAVHSRDVILKQVRKYGKRKLKSKYPVEKKVYYRNNAVYVRYECSGKQNEYTCWGFYLNGKLYLSYCPWW